MGDRRSTTMIAAVLFSVGCADPNPLLLDTVCRSTVSAEGQQSSVDACIVSGDAELVTGVSSDVMAVQFGPSGNGELRIRLNAIAATTADRWTLEALVASNRPEGSTLFRSLTWGSCGATCPADPPDVEADIDEDFAWTRVVDDSEGTSFTPGNTEVVPDDASIIFRGADLDLLDIATPGFDQPPIVDDSVPL
jgi:hypothetical protein